MATLDRPPHASLLYAVGGLWIQRLGMQKWAKLLWGWQADDFLSSTSWLHSSWTNALNIEHWSMFEIDQYVFNLWWMWSHTNIGNSTFTLIVYVLSMFKYATECTSLSTKVSHFEVSTVFRITNRLERLMVFVKYTVGERYQFHAHSVDGC